MGPARVPSRLCGCVVQTVLLAGLVWSQANEPARVLAPGTSIEDELAVQQTRTFQISSAAGQYWQVGIKRPQNDLYVSLRAPDGSLAVDNQMGTFKDSLLSLSFVSSVGGTYRLEVKRRGSGDGGGSEGRYRLTLSQPRPARPEDEKGDEAGRAYVQAEALLSDRSAGALQQRLAKYETSIALWRELGDQGHEAWALMRLGSVYQELSPNIEKELECLLRALPLSRAAGDRRLEMFVLGSIGSAYSTNGQSRRALEYKEQALALARELKDKWSEAYELTAVASGNLTMGDAAKGLQYAQQALPLWRDLHDRRGESFALSRIGEGYSGIDEPQNAMESFRAMLTLARDAKDRRDEADALDDIAGVYELLGELQKSLESRRQAIALHRAIGNRLGEGESLGGMCSVHEKLGETEQALECLHQALRILRETEYRPAEASALAEIGTVYSELGNMSEALNYYQQALAMQRSISNPKGQADALNGMGDVYLAQKQPQKAVAHYKQALELCQTAHYAGGEATGLAGLASAYLSLDEPQRSYEYLNRALSLARSTGSQLQEAEVLYSLARVEGRMNRQDEALAHAESALNLTEHLRATVAGSDVRASYLAKVRERYELVIALLMQLHSQRPAGGFDAKALEASERARARSLLDLLGESQADIRQGVEPQLLEQERSLQVSLRSKTAHRIQLLAKEHSEQQAKDLEKQLASLTTEYEDIEAQVRARSPHYASLTQPQILTASAIQHQLLDADTVLLEYSLGDEGSFLWAVTPDSISSYALPKRAEIEAAARHAYSELNANSLPVEDKATRELGRMLLGLVANPIRNKRLVVVAEGALQYIPFAALRRSQGSYLGAGHEIVSLPSASTLAVLRREMEGKQHPLKTVAVLADPVFSADDPRVSVSKTPASASSTTGSDTLERSAKDTGVLRFERLISSRREAETILSLAGKDAALEALDFDASRATALRPELGDYRIVHFASHSLLDSLHPALSGIVLSLVDRQGRSQDGFLQAHEVYNLKLNAELVVLSACQTALGKDVRGEGLIGLTRGFMYAGVPRVVASLWRVPDVATAELMKRFYDGMLREGLRPAAALRKAQAAMAKEKRWSAPYYWAGFVLQGEWR